MYTYTHTHTQTHTLAELSMYINVCVCVYYNSTKYTEIQVKSHNKQVTIYLQTQIVTNKNTLDFIIHTQQSGVL